MLRNFFSSLCPTEAPLHCHPYIYRWGLNACLPGGQYPSCCVSPCTPPVSANLPTLAANPVVLPTSGFIHRNLSFTNLHSTTRWTPLRTVLGVSLLSCPFCRRHSMDLQLYIRISQSPIVIIRMQKQKRTVLAILHCFDWNQTGTVCAEVVVVVGAPSVALLFSINTDYTLGPTVSVCLSIGSRTFCINPRAVFTHY